MQSPQNSPFSANRFSGHPSRRLCSVILEPIDFMKKNKKKQTSSNLGADSDDYAFVTFVKNSETQPDRRPLLRENCGKWLLPKNENFKVEKISLGSYLLKKGQCSNLHTYYLGYPGIAVDHSHRGVLVLIPPPTNVSTR